METTGKLIDATVDFKTRRKRLTFEVDNCSDDEVNRLYGLEKLDIKAVRRTKKRSLSANALLWHCLGKMAEALRTDKWTLYLQMLKLYGQYTYIVVQQGAVEAVKRQWRECEEVGEITMKNAKGKEVPAVQMLCYYGSSTYNSREFSILLDGVKYEMEQAGVEPPTSSEMERAIEELERNEDGSKENRNTA